MMISVADLRDAPVVVIDRYVMPLLLVAGLLIVTGCSRPRSVPAAQLIAGQTMGTTYSVKLMPFDGMPSLASVWRAIDAELELVNQQMSTYLTTSEISRFNQQLGIEWFDVSSDTAQVVQLALEIHQQSDGAFDVTVAPLVNLWGFGPKGRRPEAGEKVLPETEAIQSVLEYVGSDKLKVRLEPAALRKQHPQLQIDLSAIAKGHGVDRVSALLSRLGFNSHFVEIGGEIRTAGTKVDGQPWTAGIERPMIAGRGIQKALELSDLSLATSGNYRNYFEADGKHFSHTIDPKSGAPVEDSIASASVVAQDCASADAIATSMMSAGFTKGLALAEKNDWAVYLLRPFGPNDFEVTTSTAFRRMFPSE